jgi:hypothetical protein
MNTTMFRLRLIVPASMLLMACAGSKSEPADNEPPDNEPPNNEPPNNNDATDPAPAENEPVTDEPATQEPNPDGKDEYEAIEGPSPVGDWVSASCGDRTYERRISFFGAPSDRRTFEGQDRVSPCPEGVQCIWSGIVNFNGRWWSTDTGVGLDELGAEPMNQGIARPISLTWYDGKLVEGADCAYSVAAAP